ncbi:MAG: HesA/MoeB/ThiF family protein [Thermoplasmata archaeon]
MRENTRYSRHEILREIGREGQKILSKSRIAIIGAGALGNACANLLARAGVGEIRIVDRDIVEITNLQRQILYTERDVGKAKAETLANHLTSINSEINVIPLPVDFNPDNAKKILQKVNLVMDCTDNLLTRFLINDFCVKYKIPWIYAGVLGTSGMSYNILPGAPCFRCIFPEMPSVPLPTCETAGILNTVPVFFGAIQATEAIKILLGKEARKSLIFVDLWNFEVHEIQVAKNTACRTCAYHEYDFLEQKTGERIIQMCGANSVYIHPGADREVNIAETAHKLSNVGKVQRQGKILIANIEGKELSLFPDGGAIIKGIKTQEEAKNFYAKYIGL